MHPEVSRERFTEAVQALSTNRDLLIDRNWLVMRAEYPRFTLAVGHRKTGKLRVLDFDFTDWNDTPPSLRMVDAETGEELPGKLWPTGTAHWHQSGWISAGGIVTTQPFLCMTGILEYHTHHQHQGDHWENYRDLGGYDLPGIVIQVSEAFQKANV